jgi:hypothetical protein
VVQEDLVEHKELMVVQEVEEVEILEEQVTHHQ